MLNEENIADEHAAQFRWEFGSPFAGPYSAETAPIDAAMQAAADAHLARVLRRSTFRPCKFCGTQIYFEDRRPYESGSYPHVCGQMQRAALDALRNSAA
ncbi:hypothetical protein FUT88_13190 [Ralstonia sp. TCR112]|uniref:hypothetical protein n=1 Tax=Ralstonia sp. TCR112 TaxID=2601730 RepID=UPI0011BD6491|nr:hypothetical protein [Ralstonia sp. TCR112]TXD58830.1 hypothetical protein FUT88_13190 [Ralstonia sp. TCR112]